MGLDELGWRLWLRCQAGGQCVGAETSGTELCPWSCPVSRFLSRLLDEDKQHTLILFPDDTHSERELIHQMITPRSKQPSEGSRRMA